MKINEIARRTGLTVRTLHYYDEIGLFKPSHVNAAGYREYDREALDTLQQILFFRELEFPLAEIRKIMDNPSYDRADVLKKQETLLIKKRDRLNRLIDLIQNVKKGEDTMELTEFDRIEIDRLQQQYVAEAKERWGSTDAYQEYSEKTAAYGKEQWKAVNAQGGTILARFGALRNTCPESGEAQALVKQWQDYITERYYTCTKEILGCLGKMYTADSRFTESIDRHGAGTAAFMERAIAFHCGGE